MQLTNHRRIALKASAAAAVSLMLIASACGRRPSDVLSEDDMTALLVDLYKAEAYVATDPDYSRSDSMRIVLRQSVLADHHATEADFNRSLDWYGHNIDRLGEIYDEVETRLENEAQNPEAIKGKKKDGAASESLWSGANRIALSPYRDRDRFSFDIESGRLKTGDTEIVWEFTVPVLPGRITTFMGADYADGTYVYTSKTLNNKGATQILLSLTPGKKVKRVFGQATYIPVHRETIFVDSIRLIARPSHEPGNIPVSY